MQAMILAAGYGTRLLPHTKIRPKPLFPILNQPLLLLTIERLQRAGFSRIVVNCHHLREQVAVAVSGIDGVLLQEEEVILGTGGGLRRALPAMADEPLLVTNGDIYHTVDYRQLYDAHRRSGRRVTLAMHDFPRFNTVRTAGDRVVAFDQNGAGELLAFTGLHVLDPNILAAATDGVASCVIDLYRRLLATGESIGVVRCDEAFWTDMGTPEDYLALHAGLLTGVIPRWSEIGRLADGPFMVSDDAELAGDCELIDWCCLGRVRGGGSARLRRTVIWDGVEVPEGCKCSDRLISDSLQLDGRCRRSEP